MDDASKRRGKVKFYDATRGFGFISPDDDQPELFFHATGIDDACEFEPESGDVVEFVGGVDRKGRAAAIQVVIVAVKDGEPTPTATTEAP
jgi:cold shock protein